MSKSHTSSDNVGLCSKSSSSLDWYTPVGTAREIPKESHMSFKEFHRSRSYIVPDQQISARQIIISPPVKNSSSSNLEGIPSSVTSSHNVGSGSNLSSSLDRYTLVGTAREIPKESHMTFKEFYRSRSYIVPDQQISARQIITSPPVKNSSSSNMEGIPSPVTSSHNVGSGSNSPSSLDRYTPVGIATEIPKESHMTFKEFYRSRSYIVPDQQISVKQIITSPPVKNSSSGQRS